jgi:heterodisulfide reductase subunit A-like polyferredoxin
MLASYICNELSSINSRIKKGVKFKAEEMSLRVAVVGGGAAGLCAARHLSASG